MQRKQRGNGEVSVTALARKVSFSPPVVTILAKRPEKITRENEFELYGKWFFFDFMDVFFLLGHTSPFSRILSLSQSEFLVRQAKPARSSWLKSQPGKVSRPSVPSFASMRVIVWVKRKSRFSGIGRNPRKGEGVQPRKRLCCGASPSD